MDGIDVKKTATTQMKVKKGTMDNHKLYVEGQECDLMALLDKIFDGTVFDITVVEKNEVPVDE